MANKKPTSKAPLAAFASDCKSKVFSLCSTDRFARVTKTNDNSLFLSVTQRTENESKDAPPWRTEDTYRNFLQHAKRTDFRIFQTEARGTAHRPSFGFMLTSHQGTSHKSFRSCVLFLDLALQVFVKQLVRAFLSRSNSRADSCALRSARSTNTYALAHCMHNNATAIPRTSLSSKKVTCNLFFCVFHLFSDFWTSSLVRCSLIQPSLQSSTFGPCGSCFPCSQHFLGVEHLNFRL